MPGMFLRDISIRNTPPITRHNCKVISQRWESGLSKNHWRQRNSTSVGVAQHIGTMSIPNRPMERGTLARHTHVMIAPQTRKLDAINIPLRKDALLAT